MRVCADLLVTVFALFVDCGSDGGGGDSGASTTSGTASWALVQLVDLVQVSLAEPVPLTQLA